MNIYYLIQSRKIQIIRINKSNNGVYHFQNSVNIYFMLIFQLGYLAFLVVYAYMLLFDYKEVETIVFTHLAIACWMISLGLNEIKQVTKYSCNVFFSLFFKFFDSFYLMLSLFGLKRHICLSVFKEMVKMVLFTLCI